MVDWVESVGALSSEFTVFLWLFLLFFDFVDFFFVFFGGSSVLMILKFRSSKGFWSLVTR